jgi:DNA repair exonuclease SbcCD ATPase subunit
LSILTKISVVILVVASIVASVVFTALATVQPNWKHSYEQEIQAYNRLEGRCQEYMAEAVQVRTQMTDASSDFDSKQSSALERMQAALVAARSAEIRNVGLADNISVFTVKLAEIERTATKNLATLQQYKSERDAARDRLTLASKEVVKVADILAHAQGKNEQLQLNLKIAREAAAELRSQLAQKDETILKLSRSGGTIGKAGTGEVFTGDAITGTITAVDNQLIAINVGSANGIKKGMKLIVYRGGTFVGHIRIQKVTLDESAGLVIDKKMNPQPGDKATTRLD